MNASTATTQSGADLVRRVVDALNARDLATARRAWSAESVMRYPDRTCRGADEIAEYFADSFAAMPDWRMEVLAAAETGDDVFIRWRLTGTHLGTLAGVAATGRQLAIDGIDHLVVRDGRVVSNFVASDQLESARQVGLMPPAGSLAERTMKAAFNALTRLRRRRGRAA